MIFTKLNIFLILSPVLFSSLTSQKNTLESKTQFSPIPDPTVTWDFSDSDWQDEFMLLGQKGQDITSTWDITIDGLNFYSTQKNRWNTEYIQTGGKGSTTERVFTFTADYPGTLEVVVSNTGSAEDLKRNVIVQINDDDDSIQKKAGGYASGNRQAVTFDIESGDQKIYGDAALRFYTIKYTYSIPERVLESIYIEGTPSKLEYIDGEEFDPSGLVVKGVYDDDLGDAEITEDIEWTFVPATLTTGTTSVTVTASAKGKTSEPITINNLVVKPEEPKIGELFTLDGINYKISAYGEKNTVKIDDNTSYNGTSLNIPATVNYKNVAFDVTEIGESAFVENKNFTSLTFAENSQLSAIGKFAFAGTAITEIAFPKSLISIGKCAFDSCESLTHVTFAENSQLLNINDFAFSSSAITEIEIPSSVVTLSKGCFDYCESLVNVTFAENSKITTISEYLFEKTAITEIEIPSTVTSIEKLSFADCNDLVTIKMLPASVPSLVSSAFEGCFNLKTILVPENSVDAYTSDSQWGSFADKIKGFHIHSLKTTHNATEPTCEVAGHKTYFECVCGAYFADSNLTEEIANLQVWLGENGDGYIAPLGHHFSGNVTYTWEEDKCTASWKCDRDGCGKIESETVNGVYIKDTDATTTTNEKGHYEATFTNPNFVKQIQEANSVERPNTMIKTLSGGAIAGIAIGSTALGGISIFSIIWFFIKKRTFADLLLLFK